MQQPNNDGTDKSAEQHQGQHLIATKPRM